MTLPAEPRNDAYARIHFTGRNNMTDEPIVCGFDVGDPPDSCRCLLPGGHTGIHRCKHTHTDGSAS